MHVVLARRKKADSARSLRRAVVIRIKVALL